MLVNRTKRVCRCVGASYGVGYLVIIAVVCRTETIFEVIAVSRIGTLIRVSSVGAWYSMAETMLARKSRYPDFGYYPQ